MEKYYIIPIQVVAQWQRTERNSTSLFFRQNKNNDWVINTNCGEDQFPEIEWNSFEIIELERTDFPIPKLPTE